jgi:serine/threonine-protein kinase
MSDPVTRLNEALEGRYSIEREIGQGGMATVYLAKDLRHERQVALKVLKPELAAVVGGERFLAEIKTTAGLQHPHILPLHDSGEAEGFLFFVMPYIDGETLRDRIDREKQLPVDEALGIATAVANALQTAHDQGIVHRDIKPGNILLSRGEPLVADFGIALAVGAAGGSRLTETGLSVGTPYYMSPEQATGDQAIGAASDTYSLACVLYEMLVGEPPYPGTTAQAVLGKIIQGLPVSATATRKSVPFNVDAAIRKALEKLPADRFQGANEFAKALADPTFRHGDTPGGVEVLSAGPWNRLSVGLALSTVVLAGALGWSLTRTPAQQPTVRQVIAPMWNGQGRSIGAYTALAPDGSGMVFARRGESEDEWQLWYKSAGAVEPVALGGTEGARNVVYAPDSERIAFVSGTDIRTRPIGDGVTVTVAEDASSNMVGLAWMDDGTLLYEGAGQSIIRIPDGGGAAQTLAAWEEAAQLSFIGPLPGSAGALVNVCPTNNCAQISQLHVLDLETLEPRLLLEGVIRAWYVPTGHVMYVRTDGAVFAAPFDLGNLSLTGTGVPLFDGIRLALTSPQLAVAHDGTVLLQRGVTLTTGQREVVWMDRDGTVTALASANLPPGAYMDLALSPTDDRLAISITEDEEPRLWVKQLPDGTLTRLTTGDERGFRPEWSADGQSIVYVDEGAAWRSRADGSAERELLITERDVQEVQPLPDGSGIVVRTRGGPDARIGLYDSTPDSVESLGSEFRELNPRVSHDGRWIAYVSTQSGDAEVYVRPFPDMDAQVLVSTNGGSSPVWAHNGRELLYLAGNSDIVAATYVTEPSFQVTDRSVIANAAAAGFFRSGQGWKAFDVSADDERLVTLRLVGGGADGAALEGPVILVRHYFTELEERLGN